jgi:hypothetical protein
MSPTHAQLKIHVAHVEMIAQVTSLIGRFHGKTPSEHYMAALPEDKKLQRLYMMSMDFFDTIGAH